MKFFKPKFWDKNGISLFAIIFLPITFLIKLVNFLRKSFTKTKQFSIPVICVGNIYLGGTGKTPLCTEIFSILKKLNKKPVFIKKKYKSFKDEIRFLKQSGPVFENNKRINALETAIQNNADIAIMDDGFQDFSVKKDLSIICFNEKQWIGNGFVIPSGPLREELSSIKGADYVVINGEKNTNIENKILKYNQSIKIFYAKYKPQNINEFKNKKVVSFAGIGNPDNFFELLKENNLDILEQISFPDHYIYSNNELDKLIKKTKENNAILLTTEKDHLRINKDYKEDIKYLKVKIEINNQNQFVEEIKKFI